MKILSIRVLNGPNYWSIRRHKLIWMTLDLEDLEERPTNLIPGFKERLVQMFPGLYEHECSEGRPGGFLYRVEQGTWMGHVIEHMALELQTMAGMDVGFGRTRETSKKGIYHVVFSYVEAEAGVYTAKACVRIAEALVKGEPYDVASDIQRLREIREEERLGPSTASIVEEAASRGIPYIRLNRRSLVQLGYGINQRRIQATVASTTSNIAVEIACDKEETKNLLEQAEIPVPRGMVCYNEEDLREAVRRLGYPLVTKPIDGNHGKGATTDIRDWPKLLRGFEAARRYSRSVIVEQFIQGHDYRVLVINFKFICAARRKPAAVIGDGKSTIRQLIDQVNADPRRGYGHEKVLTAIKVDEFTLKILEEKNLTLDSVLPEGEELFLKPTANISTGGTATDVTDQVHPDNIFLCERIARIIGLDICGIDLITSDLSLPLREAGGAVLEVNAAPGFRMHLAPTEGLPRNVAEPVVNMLFPPGSNARIPIIAITGTNGKTTTTRLVAHIVKQMGYRVGFTTTDGIYINNQLMMRGDCTGPVSAQFVLKDPTVEFAVFETARGGILRAGLGFDHCDIAIVTNVQPDHLGLMGIETLDQLAKVKSVVPESVWPHGWAILNADDERVYEMRKNVSCKVAFFSLNENNSHIQANIRRGGISAVAENGYITIMKGSWKIRIERINNIPLTFGGKATFNIANILPAVLAGYLRGFDIEDIRLALQTFIPSPATTPGRMNLFQFKNFQVLCDYAHNAAGLRALAEYVKSVDASPKVGVIAGVGDRRDEDTIELGEVAAQTFDEIIIRQDRNLRGRTEEEIIGLLTTGIRRVAPDKQITVIPKEPEAIDYAFRTARPGSFIVICSDVVPDALDQIMKYKEKEMETAV
ncbi:MAG: cyanophycin synthetase [Chitinophagales bacterium]|nr:cyanophycin synthetase [Chitinophagales bacterium]MDW8428555.1 cyanophycin synthetase [Chitinophagales bacterium]